ncbi:MAG: cytochrome c [Gammaproteobacteria bacterium]|jgi:cytochrome c553|nr:cytochrome c [Gammaproteobacteria bacterium]
MYTYRTTIAGLVLALAAVLIVPAAVAGDAAAGKQKSQTCAGCHGPDGNSPTVQFPRIAGQYAGYLRQALKEYKSGERKNPIMVGMAAPLTEQDIEDLAAYFASQSGLVVPSR